MQMSSNFWNTSSFIIILLQLVTRLKPLYLSIVKSFPNQINREKWLKINDLL